jgi:hypothetical protein
MRLLTLLISGNVTSCTDQEVDWEGGISPYTVLLFPPGPYLHLEPHLSVLNSF